MTAAAAKTLKRQINLIILSPSSQFLQEFCLVTIVYSRKTNSLPPQFVILEPKWVGLNKQTTIPLKSRPSLLLFIHCCYATSSIGMQS